MPDNRQLLVEHFTERLLEQSPASVLDVGCGAGSLVRRCLEAGVEARGVEPSAADVEEAQRADLPVEQGDATRLPHADRSFDWVTLRHVPHHLEDPRAAFAEAFRVARTGLLVAEPWYDLAHEDQRLAEELDRFLKRLDRRRGMFHADVLSAAELSELFAQRASVIAVETMSPRIPYGPAELEEDLAHAAAGLELDAQERAAAEHFRSAVARGEISNNGTLIVLATGIL